MATHDLTSARLRELLHYDPETGVFTRRARTGRAHDRTVVGAVAGCIKAHGYITVSVDGKEFYAHHLAWLYMTGEWPPHGVRPANGIGTDNRWGNLLSGKPPLDLVGTTYGRLTVIAKADGARGKARWTCRCECGQIKEIDAGNLRSGRIVSCGCYNAEIKTQRVKHQMTGTPEYNSWADMWARCTNPNDPSYARYKDRAPPESWRDFRVFFAEVGQRPSPEHSIERIRNDEPYGPGNVRWATPTEQARNRTSTFYVHFGDRRLSLAQACEESGLRYGLIRGRIGRGQSVERASGGLFRHG